MLPKADPRRTRAANPVVNAEAAPKVEPFEQRLDRLGALVDQWKIELEKFWSGVLLAPPETLRARVERELRELRALGGKSVADQFRFAGLEARVASLTELAGRRQRDREEGRGPAMIAPRTLRALREPRAGLDARRGITLDGGADEAAVGALHAALVRGGTEPARVDLDAFRTYLDRQVDAIRAKTGCSAVQFRVAIEEGKPKLKAKPVGGTA